MIVIRPAQPELILPGFLHLGGVIARLPKFSLGPEEKIAGEINAEIADGGIDQFVQPGESRGIVIEISLAGSELFEMRKGRGVCVGFCAASLD